MTEFDTLVARIRATLDTDEQIAKAASAKDDGSTPTGEHWHWECNQCDTEIAIDPVTVLDEHVTCSACGGYGIALRSVEQYGTAFVGELPHFVVDTEELTPTDALHLARHDPARVLTTVAALREVVEWIDRELADDPTQQSVLDLLATLDQIGGDHA
jgi:hypothetical protein